MKIKFHREAVLDLKQGKQFYSRHSPLAAMAFGREIEAALARILDAPLRYPAGDYGTRQHVLPSRFPYTIVYRVTKELIVIVAVAHHSREPRYWRDRNPQP